jgi:hypothetical protein
MTAFTRSISSIQDQGSFDLNLRKIAKPAGFKAFAAGVFSATLVATGAQAMEKASPAEISDRMDHLVHDATCEEILPILSGPMRPGLVDEDQFDVATAILPLFIYGYAMAKGQSFDAARFELIASCKDMPATPFAGFPPYRPDPEFWPPEFIKIWEDMQD